MPRVGRFLTDQQGGLHCQIVLGSGEKVFVYHDKGGTTGGSQSGLLTIELSRFIHSCPSSRRSPATPACSR